ncbi:MAG: hypothetical protein ACREUC_13560 [Steroidobacteraceae bacterium]
MTGRATLWLALTATLLAASASAAEATWKAPRTVHGQPDLQGFWTNATITPLERDPKFGDRLAITGEEAVAIEQGLEQFVAEADKPTDPKHRIQDLPHECGFGFTGVNCGYNLFWVDPGSKLIALNGEKRSSIIVEPKNGRVPPLTQAGQGRMMSMFAAYTNAEGPERRPLGERCLLSFDSSAGPPMLPLLYNNMYQIVQTKDAVMIHIEMVHDTRIIPLASAQRPAGVRQWLGDAVGRWDGDTLVVETSNFRKEQLFRGAGEDLKVTERFTRVGPNQIAYRFTIEDPTTFTQPWSGELAFTATRERLHEYACHEGNYALPGILAGARAQEK